MLKFEGLQSGTKIRSYDFRPMVGRDDSFVEGTIIDAGSDTHGYAAYTIECTFDSHSDDTGGSRIGSNIIVPMEVSTGEYDNRITVV